MSLSIRYLLACTPTESVFAIHDLAAAGTIEVRKGLEERLA